MHGMPALVTFGHSARSLQAPATKPSHPSHITTHLRTGSGMRNTQPGMGMREIEERKALTRRSDRQPHARVHASGALSSVPQRMAPLARSRANRDFCTGGKTGGVREGSREEGGGSWAAGCLAAGLPACGWEWPAKTAAPCTTATQAPYPPTKKVCVQRCQLLNGQTIFSPSTATTHSTAAGSAAHLIVLLATWRALGARPLGLHSGGGLLALIHSLGLLIVVAWGLRGDAFSLVHSGCKFSRSLATEGLLQGNTSPPDTTAPLRHPQHPPPPGAHTLHAEPLAPVAMYTSPRSSSIAGALPQTAAPLHQSFRGSTPSGGGGIMNVFHTMAPSCVLTMEIRGAFGVAACAARQFV